jgi:hypothetical protein
LDYDPKKSIWRRFYNWIKNIQTFKLSQEGVEITQKIAEQQKSKISTKAIHFHETHINAWIKCYNQEYPNCGFYRIWDYPPINLTDKMAQELTEIARGISDRISRPII